MYNRRDQLYRVGKYNQITDAPITNGLKCSYFLKTFRITNMKYFKFHYCYYSFFFNPTVQFFTVVLSYFLQRKYFYFVTT